LTGWGEFTDYEREIIELRNRGNEDIERLLAVLKETENQIADDAHWREEMARNEGFVAGWNAALKQAKT
jgi:hypothetical protein